MKLFVVFFILIIGVYFLLSMPTEYNNELTESNHRDMDVSHFLPIVFYENHQAEPIESKQHAYAYTDKSVELHDEFPKPEKNILLIKSSVDQFSINICDDIDSPSGEIINCIDNEKTINLGPIIDPSGELTAINHSNDPVIEIGNHLDPTATYNFDYYKNDQEVAIEMGGYLDPNQVTQ